MVFAKAPSVSESEDFVNLILEKESYGIRVLVDKSRCKTFIKEFEYTKESEDGGIQKKMIEDSKLKIRYQFYGHISDILRYFFVAKFSGQFRQFTGKGNDHKPQTIPRKRSNNVF